MGCNCGGSVQQQPRIVRSVSGNAGEGEPIVRLGGPGDGLEGGYYASQRSQPRPKNWPPRQFKPNHPDAARD